MLLSHSALDKGYLTSLEENGIKALENFIQFIQFKQCEKNVNKWFMYFNVCLLSLLSFKMVSMT